MEENRKIACQKHQKRIVVMNENEEIMFQTISDASRNLSIPMNTIKLQKEKQIVVFHIITWIFNTNI